MKRSDAGTHQPVRRVPADIKDKGRGATVAVHLFKLDAHEKQEVRAAQGGR